MKAIIVMRRISFIVVFSTGSNLLWAQGMKPSGFSFSSPAGLCLFIVAGLLLLLWAVIMLRSKVINLKNGYRKQRGSRSHLQEHLDKLNSRQLERLMKLKRKEGPGHDGKQHSAFSLFLIVLLLSGSATYAQQPLKEAGSSLMNQGGIILTIILVMIPLLLAIVLLIVKINNLLGDQRKRQGEEEAAALADDLEAMPGADAIPALEKRRAALDYSLTHHELSGIIPAEDRKGLLMLNGEPGLPIVATKKKALPRPNIDPALSKLVLWYLGTACFWLVFGTTVGEYVGIKFVAPDADHISWLSFGRLRPVHTNAVFWGWASLAMLGLGYYIVPRVSNTKLASIRMGWYALALINISVVAGTICLMAGINNGGGEYREYVWPVMLLFAIGLVMSLMNYIRTIASRTTTEIYISNWYMVSAVIFTIVISLAAYIPSWQNGLGETIIQGYYMHQGVGMWFMLFTLGIVYYFLPQQLNKPIYSYSLGILAFWTQILFYTLIGTHHFVFSAIPWWLQTVAIVGSAGMAIPVIAGTTNFLMTFKGAWHKVRDSYTLPFFLVGIIFYFTGSMQGTAEAFRFTNLIWHFTDFTVAHSHLTMYGIVSFFLWACTYAVVPRLTGKEAPQIMVGAHFWLALIGLMFYTIPLMYGGTMKGLMWLNGKPFIETVSLMAPYWLWRAIGGSLMWLSHLFFAYNMYKMIAGRQSVDVREIAIQKMEEKNASASTIIA
ncbi:cbb3-type cytochrome c oxidase subunit I [Pseudoflavitalea rhizosphaerae]|uniref:cbb3-type cytochrome c oxidase subunit I n=1 Tax=Pseudoflavitalea rhizosphaerae TaxID=1884793 RepID=UPI0019D2223E|nr:cbb3-type cytochrome c oxidase subunit I [Pseudoflavitalea rhizosphaerae]